MDKNSLVIISGATGVGKTALSIELAKLIGGEIISADSMQVYKGFDIGTAKIRPEETDGIRHHLIDIFDPDREFSVYEFQTLAKKAMSDIYKNGHIPIIVGGTGFYIQSVVYDIDFEDGTPDRAYREELEKLAAEKGPEYLHDMLKSVDPESAESIHANNVKRVIRALTYFKESGRCFSEYNEEQSRRESPYNFAYFVLNRERKTIYERINKRVDKMIEDGLEREVRTLLESGISPGSLAMQGLGYKEIVPCILGSTPIEEAADILKTRTRHFAKKQNTWFKREKETIWVSYEDYKTEEEMLMFMVNVLKEKKIV